MTILTVASCTNAEDMEFTISTTATLKDWKEIKEAFKSAHYPQSKLIDQIVSLVHQFEHQVYNPKEVK